MLDLIFFSLTSPRLICYHNVNKSWRAKVKKMDIFNAALAALMLVIITMTVRDWIQALREANEERRKRREKMKYYKYK